MFEPWGKIPYKGPLATAESSLANTHTKLRNDCESAYGWLY